MGHVTWCKSNPLIGSIKHYYVPLHDNFTQHSPWGFGTNTETMKLAEERCKQEKKKKRITSWYSTANHNKYKTAESQWELGVNTQ